MQRVNSTLLFLHARPHPAQCCPHTFQCGLAAASTIPGRPAPVPTSMTRITAAPPGELPVGCELVLEVTKAEALVIPPRALARCGEAMTYEEEARCLSMTGSSARLSPTCRCHASSGSLTAAGTAHGHMLCHSQLGLRTCIRGPVRHSPVRFMDL